MIFRKFKNKFPILRLIIIIQSESWSNYYLKSEIMNPRSELNLIHKAKSFLIK